MEYKKLLVVLFAAVLCGCEAQKVAEPQGPVVQKNKKEAASNRMRMDVSEPP